MQIWEAVRLLEEGKILEDNKGFTFRMSGAQIFIERDDPIKDIIVGLGRLLEDLHIKPDPIDFQKALDYMQQGYICECSHKQHNGQQVKYQYRLFSNAIFYYNDVHKEWYKCDTSLSAFLEGTWYLRTDDNKEEKHIAESQTNSKS